MKLQGKRAVVLVEDLYEDQELWYPVVRLREEGVEVAIAGPQADHTYTSKHGYPARSDVAADQVNVQDLDALIIPGGYSPDRMRRHAAMVDLVAKAFQAGKVVAAICHGGWMLASADILQGKQVTCFFSIKDDLVHAGATFLDQEVVVDDNLVTSRNPNDLPAFMRTIIGRMGG